MIRPTTNSDVAKLRAIRERDEVSQWWGPLEVGWPFDDEECARYSVEYENDVVGFIQWTEEPEPDYRHAGIDLFLSPDVHAIGLGQEAISGVRDYLVAERGHHRITIDPAAANAAAIRCYERCGFTTVGIMRKYERDHDGGGWHDGLLMEYVAESE